MRVNDEPIRFDDRIQGRQEQSLEGTIGDFVVRRADGIFSYQLAVVVDDAAQQITEVVRGADLLGSTGRQIFLQQLLDLETPSYAHIPVVVAADGEKLSKQNLAAPVAGEARELHAALRFLGQEPPQDLLCSRELLAWAVRAWSETRIPQKSACEWTSLC